MSPWLILLVAACAADVAATANNLRAGGKEINFLPAALMNVFGPWPVMIGTKALFIGVAIGVHQMPFTVALAAMNFGAAAYSFAHRKKSP